MQGGADANAEDMGGQKPIHAAAAEQQRDIVELLLPLTSSDQDNASNWTVEGIIQEAQQSIADDDPQEQQHQVQPNCKLFDCCMISHCIYSSPMNPGSM